MRDDRTITTDRLHLRPLHPDDALDLFPVFSHPEAMRYWDHARHTDADRTRTLLQEMIRGDACWWAIRRQETSPAIGLVGFIANTAVPGLGYILHPDHWRQGIMTEALRAAVDYGFTVRDVDRAELWIFADNIPSQKLAEKVGFTRRGAFVTRYHHLPTPAEMRVYGLARPEWAGQPAPQPPAYTLQPVLGVADVLATAVDYRDRLGFTIDFLYGNPPTHAGLALADWTASGARLQITHQPDAEPDHTTALYIFVGANIDALYERYQAAGLTFEHPLTTHPWGRREFTLRDRNGYHLRFGAPA